MSTDKAAVHVMVDVRIVDPPRFPVEQFHAKGTELMDALVEIEESCDEVADVSIGGNAAAMVWTIDMVVYTDDDFHALMTALSVIRTAIHALGDATPDWPTSADFAPGQVQVERMLVPA